MFRSACAATSENEIPLRQNTTTNREYLPHMVKFGQENTGSRSPQASTVCKIWMLVLVFALNFILTRVIPIACFCACIASENKDLVLSLVMYHFPHKCLTGRKLSRKFQVELCQLYRHLISTSSTYLSVFYYWALCI